MSADLQKAIYERLVADTTVHAIVADRIYDGVPEGAAYPHVSFGPSTSTDDDDECIIGSEVTLQIDCWTRSQGRLGPCRDLVRVVKTSLHDYAVDLDTDALVSMRVTLTRVFLDPDNITGHGVVQVTALIEEN